MVAIRRLFVLLALSLLLVACPRKDDDKGKVPFGLESSSKTDRTSDKASKKDAAKEAGLKDGGIDGGDAAVDAQELLTPEQLFRERVLRSLRIGKVDEELKTWPLEKVEKVGSLSLRGVAPPVALSRLHQLIPYSSAGSFVDPTQGASIKVRGPQGGGYSLVSKVFTPGAAEPSVVSDTTGRYTIVEKKVACDGVRLIVAKSDEVVAGVLAGKPAAKPWVRRNEEPTQCNKVELEPLAFKVLGWTGQGIVFFIDGSFFVQEAPLSSDALPRELDFGPGLPAPLPEGFASNDGRTVLIPTKLGVLTYSSGEAPRLVTDKRIGANSHVAFSQAGDELRLVWTHDGHLYQATLPAAS